MNRKIKFLSYIYIKNISKKLSKTKEKPKKPKKFQIKVIFWTNKKAVLKKHQKSGRKNNNFDKRLTCPFALDMMGEESPEVCAFG